MSYTKATEAILKMIRAVPRTIEPKLPFHTGEDESGYAPPIDEIDGDVTRAFDVRLGTVPIDDGQSGWEWSRYKAGINVRVRYPTLNRELAERMLADDVSAITNYIIRPSNWPSGSTLEHVQQMQGTLSTISNDQGVVVALMATLPFEITYSV